MGKRIIRFEMEKLEKRTWNVKRKSHHHHHRFTPNTGSSSNLCYRRPPPKSPRSPVYTLVKIEIPVIILIISVLWSGKV